MKFEEFNSKNTNRALNDIGVTITSTRGEVLFGRRSIERYFKSFGYVLLYFDKERQLIGVKPCEVRKESSYKFYNKQNRGRTASISAKTFLDHHRINYRESIFYSAYWDEKEQLFVVDLKKGRKNGRGSQRVTYVHHRDSSYENLRENYTEQELTIPQGYEVYKRKTIKKTYTLTTFLIRDDLLSKFKYFYRRGEIRINRILEEYLKDKKIDKH